jgi:hypothetical protein
VASNILVKLLIQSSHFFSLFVQSYFNSHSCAGNLLINLLSGQLMLDSFRICIHSVHFRRPNVVCQYIAQGQKCSSVYKVRSDNILSIRTSLSSSKPKLIFSNYNLNFPLNPPSKNPRYYLCSVSSEANCAIVAGFCSFQLLL